MSQLSCGLGRGGKPAAPVTLIAVERSLNIQKSLFVILALLAPLSSFAEDISDSDIATYALTRQDGRPTGMQMRLSKNEGKWVMEGKEANTPWKNLSCDKGCEYRVSTLEEKEAYSATLPSGMSQQFEIACIQNMANAFCRLTRKDDSAKGGYALIALVTGRSVPMSLQRLTRPYSSPPAAKRSNGQ